MKTKDIDGNEFILQKGHATQRLEERLNGVIPVMAKKPLSHVDYKKAEKGLPYNFILQSIDGKVKAPLVKVKNKFFIKTFITT